MQFTWQSDWCFWNCATIYDYNVKLTAYFFSSSFAFSVQLYEYGTVLWPINFFWRHAKNLETSLFTTKPKRVTTKKENNKRNEIHTNIIHSYYTRSRSLDTSSLARVVGRVRVGTSPLHNIFCIPLFAHILFFACPFWRHLFIPFFAYLCIPL